MPTSLTITGSRDGWTGIAGGLGGAVTLQATRTLQRRRERQISHWSHGNLVNLQKVNLQRSLLRKF